MFSEKAPKTIETTIADIQSRESLPKIGKPMVVIEKNKSPDKIAGVEKIDQNQKINWENLIFVRTTEVPPTICEDKLLVQTPYSGTADKPIDKIDPRTTTHWTINHHIRATAGGWNRPQAETLPYIIMAPAKNLVELNSEPKNFADVDTYWDKDLILPPNTVIISQPNAKINLPTEQKEQIHVVKRDQEKSAEQDVAEILSKMGFTPIKGGQKYSRTQGISEVFNEFAKQQNLDSGSHQFDETNRFENKFSQLDNSYNMLQALSVFTDPAYQPANEQIAQLIKRKLEAITRANINDISRFAQKNKISESQAAELFAQAKKMIAKK